MNDGTWDAIVIGSGPNGLTAAVVLARRGWRVLVLEAESEIGGGTRSSALTLPGFVHDVCSAVHPLAIASPVFRALNLEEHGLSWIHSSAPLAHPLDDGSAVVIEREIEATAGNLGEDAGAYSRLMTPLVSNWSRLLEDVLAPPRLPRHPLVLARFGRHAIRSASAFADAHFSGIRARASFAGIAAHSVIPFDRPLGTAVALVLGAAAHAAGWPIPRGGAGRIADALASCLRAAGGEIVTGSRVSSLEELPRARAVLCDLSPRGLAQIGARRLPSKYRRQLERFRYGPGVFKVDWALSRPIPWQAAACARATTVHVGGTLEEIAGAELAPWQNRTAARPFVLLAQPTLADPSRAPGAAHVAWAYCHVPHASDEDMTARIEAQVERFAPGFRSCILARHVRSARELQRHNDNLVGGDVTGGVMDLVQSVRRPTWSAYRTPVRGLYLCSASTPPGGGVHGMCGYHAARAALADLGD